MVSSIRHAAPTSEARGWLRIGPCTGAPKSQAGVADTADSARSATPEPEWEIDLPLRIAYSWALFVSGTVALGLLLAVPGIIGYWLQDISTSAKIAATTWAAIAGLAAAAIAGLGIKKKV